MNIEILNNKKVWFGNDKETCAKIQKRLLSLGFIWVDGKKNDVSCEYGIHFYEHKIGKDLIFDELKTNPKIDIIFAFNYLHHLKNELGLETFNNTIDSYFKNSKEVIFEINDCEIDDIEEISLKNNFILKNKIESHRKTSFGNRWILYYSNF